MYYDRKQLCIIVALYIYILYKQCKSLTRKLVETGFWPESVITDIRQHYFYFYDILYYAYVYLC